MAVFEFTTLRSQRQEERADALRAQGFDPSLSRMAALKRTCDLYFGLRRIAIDRREELRGKLVVLEPVSSVTPVNLFDASGIPALKEKCLAFSDRGPCTVSVLCGDNFRKPIPGFFSKGVRGHLGMRQCFYLAQRGANVESIHQALRAELDRHSREATAARIVG